MKQSLSIVILSLSSLSALANEGGQGCAWKLAEHAKVSSQITGTLTNRVYARAAAFARWWRNDKVPAEVEKAQRDLAKLEENLLHDDRLDEAVHQTKGHIEAVEFSYVMIKHHIEPMRKIFRDITTALKKSKDENLNIDEISKLEEAFMGVAENYAEAKSYGRLSKEGKAVHSLKVLETLFTSKGDKEISRQKVIELIEFVDGYLVAQEADFAREIGKNITTYEMLKSYMTASFEDRHLAYAIRTDNIDEIFTRPIDISGALTRPPAQETVMGAGTPLPDSSPSSAPPMDKAAILAARKAAWEENIGHLRQKVGWEAELKDRFPALGNINSPAIKDIKDYYNRSIQARLTHNRRSALRETRITFFTQLLDLTLVGSVIRPIAAQLFSGPGKLRRALNIVREWSQKTRKSLILKNIQELAESKESTIEKAANLAIYASDARTGTYFLQLFASYADLNSRIVWKEIHDYTKTPDSLYPDLGKMMDQAKAQADKITVPVALQSSYWSPSQTAAVVVWVLGFGYYNMYGDNDEELDNKVRQGLMDDLRDLFGFEPDPNEAPQPAVVPDTLDGPSPAPTEEPTPSEEPTPAAVNQ